MSVGRNLGVVIGLILLILELNQNSDLVRAQIHQARSDAQVSILEGRSDTEYLVPAIAKIQNAGGLRDLSSTDQLNDIELARFRYYLASRFTDYDDLFFQYQRGYLDEEYYQYTVAGGIAIFGPWWKKLAMLGQNRRPSFVAEINRLTSTD